MMQSQVTHEVNTPPLSGLKTPEARITAFLETELAKLGYELVAVDLLNHREKRLCVYIDFLSETEEGVGIDDCVKVTRELDEPLETNEDVMALFKGAYELEVSSPGIDRPLRKPSDFNKYIAQIARISTFRALTSDESKAPDYTAKNPKQKNFFGIVRGFETASASILFGIIPDDGTREILKKKTKTKTEKPKPETLIRIPLELVAKANLDPEVALPEQD